MSKLATLHEQLTRLKNTRSTVRAVTALAALVTAVCWSLAVVFGLDVVFELPLLPRLVVMMLGALAIFWAYTKFTQPMLGVEESELQMALMVERQQRIDSDLVAALQFEGAEAKQWGSQQLEVAVIDYVAEFGSSLNVFEGFSRQQMTRRAVVLGLTLLAVALFVVVAPGYASTFLNRMLLGSRHYPSATTIEQVLVNDTIVIERDSGSAAPATAMGAEGHAVLFYVQCSGRLPTMGKLRVRGERGGSSRQVDMKSLTPDQRLSLLRTAQAKLDQGAKGEVDVSQPWQDAVIALCTFDAPQVAEKLRDAKEDRAQLSPLVTQVQEIIEQWPRGADKTAVYVGDMGRLVDSVNYSILLGDAWTDSASVKMIPLPVVELEPTIVPPAYARQKEEKPEELSASRQLAVLEGSEVKLTLRSKNKRLKEAWLTTKGQGDKQKFQLTKTDASDKEWKLETPMSPLSPVREELQYEVQVTDADGLHLESPIKGVIRLRPDRPPSGAIDVVHRVVLPTAVPVIGYRIHDDYGISKLALKVVIEHNRSMEAGAEASGETPPATAEPDRVVTVTLHEPTAPPILTPRPVIKTHPLELSSLMLVKGDRLKITLETTDYRGDAQGQATLSEPIVLEISDEAGVTAAILSTDERTEQQITDILKQLLGSGESP